jgi:hypothetical protein
MNPTGTLKPGET